MKNPPDFNEATLKAYNAKVDNYVSKTAKHIKAGGDYAAWLDRVLSQVKIDAKILEIGSGFGRDAKYILDRGYNLTLSDASISFVKLLKNSGYEAILLNVLTDDIKSSYDLIFAQAVFHHFTRPQLKLVLTKIHKSLAPHGVLAFSVKKGDGQAWTKAKLGKPRFFQYWQAEPLNQLLIETKYTDIEITSRSAKSAEWLQVLARI